MKKVDKKYMEKLELLRIYLNDIYYEIAKGIHTYSGCKCGRAITRSGCCHMCVVDKMDNVIKKLKSK